MKFSCVAATIKLSPAAERKLLWWSRLNQKPPKTKSVMNQKLLEDRCTIPQSGVLYINLSWEAAVLTEPLDPDTEPWSWTEVACWSHGQRRNPLEENLFCHNEHQRVWRREVEAFTPENTTPTVQHGTGGVLLWGGSAASTSAALKKLNGIMKKKDYLQILQESLKSSAGDWFLGAVWWSISTMIQTHIRSGKGTDPSGQNWGFERTYQSPPSNLIRTCGLCWRNQTVAGRQ